MRKISLPLLLLSTCLQAAVAQDWSARLDSAFSVLEKRGQFAGQIVIAENNKVVFQNSYGKLKDTKADITDHTPLDVASVSKTLTAAAIMLLADRGKLSYDDLLETFLPEIPYRGITIRHLLSHTSGLPNIFGLILKEFDPNRYYTNNDILELLIEHQPEANFPPGTQFEYCNLGYELLALIIEKISGTNYTHFIRKNILEPLEMDDTFHFSENSEFQAAVGKATIDNFWLMTVGTSNYYSTAQDLFKWDQSFYSAKILKKETIAAIYEQPLLKNSERGSWGLGWSVQSNEKNNLVVQHMGEGANSTSVLTRYVSDRNTYIFIHNGSRHYAYEAYIMAKNIWEDKPFQLPELRKVHTIETQKIMELCGDYGENGFMHLTYQNGRIYLQADGGADKMELVPSSDSTFYFLDQPMEWQIYKDGKGEVIGFGIRGDREKMMKRQN